MTDKPQEVILGFSTKTYFDMMANLMCKVAPPAAEDAPILAKLAKIGLEPCKKFDLAARSTLQYGLQDLPKDGLAKINSNREMMGKEVNNWVIIKIGRFGTDYMKRAVAAAFGWPANLPEDAVYPYTQVDSTGAPLDGANG